MNRSFSKIRHIQEANQRLEKRILNETTEFDVQGQQINVSDDAFKNEMGNLADPKCKSSYEPYFNDAKKWWIDWLSSSVTKNKFRKNWNVGTDDKIDGMKVDDLFKKYISTINNIKLVYLTKNADILPVDALAGAIAALPEYLFINCPKHFTGEYSAKEIIIHEIQHIIYRIKPLSPTEQIDNSIPNINFFVNMLNKKFGLDIKMVDYNKISKNNGLKYESYLRWLKIVDDNKNNKNDNYDCETTEKMSNIQGMRYFFNLKPGQDLTLEMLKPYINFEKPITSNLDVGWFLSCWAKRGFGDINAMLSRTNQLAMQDPQNNNTSVA